MSDESDYFCCFEGVGAKKYMHETDESVLFDILVFDVIVDQKQPQLSD